MLNSRDFPPGTPLHHFFAWNEGRRRPDRRYQLVCAAGEVPQPLADALDAAIGNPDIAAHAAVFAAFDALDRIAEITQKSSWPGLYRGPSAHGLDPWASLDPRVKPGDDDRESGDSGRRILVIRLSAFGDFVQALGAFAAIRQHHRADRLTLLTTGPLADFATELGLFDEVLTDERPGPLAPGGWLRLRQRLRRGGFARVYDLQTSQRSAAYAALFPPGMPEWSGIAWGCSHPHANRDRDRQHTIDKQAEQLLMAGIYPTPLPSLPPFDRALPEGLATSDFVLLVPGSSPRHPEKRWPAERFAALARALDTAGYVPVVVGSAPEKHLGATIRDACPAVVDLVGRTDLGMLAALAQCAMLTVGNDSGVCHLAAAGGCPVIVLFSGGTDPERCAPRGRLVRVITEPDLAGLAAESVIADALAILQAPQAVA